VTSDERADAPNRPVTGADRLLSMKRTPTAPDVLARQEEYGARLPA